MKEFIFEKDINVLFVQATSFPDGIQDAFNKLKNSLPSKAAREIFGISWADREGKITYRAAAEMKSEDEITQSGLDSFIIKKGIYISELVKDFMKNTPRIGVTFNQLLKHPGIDKKGYCLEWYQGNDVLCLVKLNPVKQKQLRE